MTGGIVNEPREPAPNCPLCAAPGHFHLAQPDRLHGLHPQMHHAFFFCPGCRHLYSHAIATDLLLSFYPPEYYRQEGGRLRAAIDRLRQRNRARSVEWRAQKGKALDIGCGRGKLLEQLRQRGWQVAGMDWNADNARAVAQRLQVPVAAGPDALESFEPTSFDAISMFHVLEHDQQPLDLLRRVNRILKPGGRLLVAIPNFASLARRLFGRHWSGYDFSRHRQVFTPRSVVQALQASGFRNERLGGRFSDELLDVQGSAQLLLRSRGLSSAALTAAVTLGAFSLVALPRLFGQNSVMYAFARKL